MTVVILTKRNPEGVSEIRDLLQPVLSGVRIIGTINADGDTVEKSIIARDLVQSTDAKVLHFLEDSEPHRLAMEREFKDDPIEMHIYEVCLKTQLVGPIVERLMSMYG